MLNKKTDIFFFLARLVATDIVKCFVQGHDVVTLMKAPGRVCLLSTDFLINKITSYFVVG